jgi:hypothetical protein
MGFTEEQYSIRGGGVLMAPRQCPLVLLKIGLKEVEE